MLHIFLEELSSLSVQFEEQSNVESFKFEDHHTIFLVPTFGTFPLCFILIQTQHKGKEPSICHQDMGIL